MRAALQPTVFYSHGRMPWTTMTLFVRGRQPESVVKPVTAALHELDPTLVVSNVRTIESALAESLARERISALISTSFGIGGLLLAALGLYGLLAYLVAERTKDIGRIALGARLAHITGSVVAGGLALVAIGTAIGIAGSLLLLLRPLGALLFGVTPYDVPAFSGLESSENGRGIVLESAPRTRWFHAGGCNAPEPMDSTDARLEPRPCGYGGLGSPDIRAVVR